MNININNYEAFFLDYYEGNLSPQQVADVLLFVEQHPELKEEFESFENFSIAETDNIVFENKNSLKKQITADNIEEFMAASVDGTLNKTENDLLNTYLKQHPQYQKTAELFQKTKLTPDFSIVFENKEDLKRIDKTQEFIIASIEGLLTTSESNMLQKQLSADAQLKYDLELFQKTKLVADSAIRYKNKEDLKRKEARVIPLFYYVAAAASIALLFGLFTIFNNQIDNMNYADSNTAKENKNETVTVAENKIKPAAIISQEKTSATTANTNKIIAPKNNTTNIIAKQIEVANNSEKNNNEFVEVKENVVQSQVVDNSTQTNNTLLNENPIAKENQTSTTTKQNANELPNEFVSLRELAAEKIKQKTLDDATIQAQKKSGKHKKITGWDVAQIVTKGVSKVVGRDVEVKPKYNDEGKVIAYALGNGLEVTRGK